MTCTCQPGAICTCGQRARTINLTRAGNVGEWLARPPGATSCAVQIDADATLGWGAAVVAVQYKIDDGTVEVSPSGPAAQAFSPSVTLSTSTRSNNLIAIGNATHVRLSVTTGAAAADPKAQYCLVFA